MTVEKPNNHFKPAAAVRPPLKKVLAWPEEKQHDYYFNKDEIRKLISTCQEGQNEDKQARDLLVNSQMAMLKRKARDYAEVMTADTDEILKEAKENLRLAVQDFNPQGSIGFQSFAQVRTITFLQKWWCEELGVPYNLKDRRRKAKSGTQQHR